MDAEQLKMILETIGQLGGDAREFGIWYLMATTLPEVVSSVLLFAFGVLALVVAKRTACYISNSCARWSEVFCILGMTGSVNEANIERAVLEVRHHARRVNGE